MIVLEAIFIPTCVSSKVRENTPDILSWNSNLMRHLVLFYLVLNREGSSVCNSMHNQSKIESEVSPGSQKSLLKTET